MNGLGSEKFYVLGALEQEEMIEGLLGEEVVEIRSEDAIFEITETIASVLRDLEWFLRTDVELFENVLRDLLINALGPSKIWYMYDYIIGEQVIQMISEKDFRTRLEQEDLPIETVKLLLMVFESKIGFEISVEEFLELKTSQSDLFKAVLDILISCLANNLADTGYEQAAMDYIIERMKMPRSYFVGNFLDVLKKEGQIEIDEMSYQRIRDLLGRLADIEIESSIDIYLEEAGAVLLENAENMEDWSVKDKVDFMLKFIDVAKLLPANEFFAGLFNNNGYNRGVSLVAPNKETLYCAERNVVKKAVAPYGELVSVEQKLEYLSSLFPFGHLDIEYALILLERSQNPIDLLVSLDYANGQFTNRDDVLRSEAAGSYLDLLEKGLTENELDRLWANPENFYHEIKPLIADLKLRRVEELWGKEIRESMLDYLGIAEGRGVDARFISVFTRIDISSDLYPEIVKNWSVYPKELNDLEKHYSLEVALYIVQKLEGYESADHKFWEVFYERFKQVDIAEIKWLLDLFGAYLKREDTDFEWEQMAVIGIAPGLQKLLVRNVRELACWLDSNDQLVQGNRIFDLSTMYVTLPTLQPRKTLEAASNAGVTGLLEYLRYERAECSDPIDYLRLRLEVDRLDIDLAFKKFIDDHLGGMSGSYLILPNEALALDGEERKSKYLGDTTTVQQMIGIYFKYLNNGNEEQAEINFREALQNMEGVKRIVLVPYVDELEDELKAIFNFFNQLVREGDDLLPISFEQFRDTSEVDEACFAESLAEYPNVVQVIDMINYCPDLEDLDLRFACFSSEELELLNIALRENKRVKRVLLSKALIPETDKQLFDDRVVEFV